MRSRFIPLTIFVVVVAGLIAAAWIWDGDGRWDRDHDNTHVVSVVDDQGQPVGDGTAVIIDRDRGPFFFPFAFLLFPLFIFLLFWTFGRGGRPANGPNGFHSETPPQWFERWYQQMKRRERDNSSDASDTPSRNE